ncbi:MAG: DNA repair protein RecN [Rhodospirillales bacterium]|nr:DNA repair protein RecN [Rhodospirillales bacterium]
MLSALSIRDIVLIDRLDLEFEPGLSALTGESGAGKSILLDALGLALGGRADARLVRHGAAQGSVTAAFLLPPHHPLVDLLAEQDIRGDDEALVLRRVVGADGRSRAFVNDQPVGVGLMRQIGDGLVEIHGQFDNQRLLSPVTHRSLLDAFAGLQVGLAATAEGWAAAQAADAALATAEAEATAARRDEDYLRHAAEELDRLDPQPDEEAVLAETRARLMSGEKIVQAMADAGRALAGEEPMPGAGASIQAALRPLERVAALAGGRLDAAVEALTRSYADIVEAQAQLDRALTAMDLDPRRLEEAEERLFALRAAARKHGCTVADLPALRGSLAERLAGLDDGVLRLGRLRQAAAAAHAAYGVAADDLGAARREAAARLDARVMAELAPLNLGRAVFRTAVRALAPPEWGAHGKEQVIFEVATNPGSPTGPLSRIASGGELARFMLALKVVLAQADPVPTLIFDEVDAGVGGAVADAVGERLARLGEEVQVLVLTHSPQVAARGAHHWRVRKAVAEGDARTRIDVLAGDERREELARMLAGARITDEARAAADSLLLRKSA